MTNVSGLWYNITSNKEATNERKTMKYQNIDKALEALKAHRLSSELDKDVVEATVEAYAFLNSLLTSQLGEKQSERILKAVEKYVSGVSVDSDFIS